MTHNNAVCPNLKWTITSETINHDGRFEEVIRTYVCKYKGYTFNYRVRDYSEWATDDEPSYSEREETIYCSETWDLVAEDWECCDANVVNYVKWLTKKQRTKDIIIDMLLRTNLVYWFWDCKYFKYWWQYEKCNYKTKLKFLKQDLKQLSLWELHKLLSYSNIKRAMKMCTWKRCDYKWETYYQAFHLDSNDEVVWEFMNDYDYEWDYECDKHSPFYLLARYNWMQF